MANAYVTRNVLGQQRGHCVPDAFSHTFVGVRSGLGGIAHR
jgi:hypothetical protein